MMEGKVDRVLILTQRISCATNIGQLKQEVRELRHHLIQVSPEELTQLQSALGSRAVRQSQSPLSEPKEVLVELLTYALVVATESVFLCVWACVLWGVTEVLKRIVPHMPDWAPVMFRDVEIAFAIFILAKLFIVRAEVFEEAIRRLRRVTRAWFGRS